MKRIIIYHILALWALICSAVPSLAQTVEYPVAWNAGSCDVEISVGEGGASYSQIGSAVSSYITSNSIGWVSLDSVDSGSTSETCTLCFLISDNTGGSSRSADFTPWGFRIIQAAQGVSGPVVSEPYGGSATIYPGAQTLVTVDNLTSSTRVALKRRDLAGNTWTEVDSLSLTAPSCSFRRVLSDGEYQLAPLGVYFTLSYPDICYYTYSVSGLPAISSINRDGDYKTGQILGYYDTSAQYHSADSTLVGKLQDLFAWYGTGNAAGWDPDLQLHATLSSGKAVVTALCPPNFGDNRIWHTRLHIHGSGAGIDYAQNSGGDLRQKTATRYGSRVQISSAQAGVTYTATDGEHSVSMVRTSSSTLNLYLSGSGIYGSFSVYASYGGRRRLMSHFRLENDGPYTEGAIESAGPNSISTLTVNDGGDAQDIVYYNGLGLRKQEVSVRASGNGQKDVVRPVRLDHLGREWRTYLPYAVSGTAGSYRSSAYDDQPEWWHGQDGCEEGVEFAYSTTMLESAVPGRKLSECLPGEDYHDSAHDTDYSYSSCSLPKLSVSSGGTLSRSGNYSSGTLLCSSRTDADGRETVTVTDREGRTLADGPSDAMTLYAYDSCGRLAWMISPEGAALLTGNGSWTSESDFASKYCYVYIYDSRGRQVEKHLPGAAVQYFVYDADDRTAFFQDGNMRAAGKWKALFYDSAGRLVREDLRTGGGATRTSLQSAFDASVGAAPALYTTTSGVTLLRTYVWDAYPAGMDSRLAFSSNSVATQAALRSSHKGLQVYEDLNVLGTAQYARRARYFDREDRVIQEVTLYPDGTLLRKSSSYDIQGRPLETISAFSDNSAVSGKSVRLEDSFGYDARGRQTDRYSYLVADNQSAYGYVEFTYDDIGRPWKTVYGTAFEPQTTQTISYTMQGWETERTVVDDYDNLVFSSILRYRTPLSEEGYSGVNNPVSWTGNVSSWQWQHGGMPLNAWALSYDTLGRLSASSHYSGKVPDNMHSEAFSYDRNSNIVSHSIYSGGSTPEVTSFTLVGNQRYDYDYDDNGNLTCMHDLITPESYEDYSSTLSYNLLNLPLHLTTDGDDYLDYRYLADGTKISAIGYEDYGFKYAGPFRYRVELGDAFIENSEAAGGRIWCYDENDPDTPAPETRYFITDHLGSTRVVLKGDGTLSMKADYLPYGGLISGSGLNVAENDYLWTGKELQHQLFDTPAYDSSARYLLTNGLFASLDPLAEKYPGISPYAYCAGNPISRIDKSGNCFETAFDVVSLVADVHSFVSNIKEGNVGGAIVDGIGTVFDAAAVFLPIVPAVAGHSIKAIRALDKGTDALKAADRVVDGAKAADRTGDVSKATGKTAKTVETSRAARREAMRESGIPTSQQPASQFKTKSGYVYNYDAPTSSNSKNFKSVQQQTLDRSHPNAPHWEAGNVKMQDGKVKYNSDGVPSLYNEGKAKVYYRR